MARIGSEGKAGGSRIRVLESRGLSHQPGYLSAGTYGRKPSSAFLSLPLQRKPLQQIIQLQLRRLPPIEDRLDDLRREQRQPQNLG